MTRSFFSSALVGATHYSVHSGIHTTPTGAVQLLNARAYGRRRPRPSDAGEDFSSSSYEIHNSQFDKEFMKVTYRRYDQYTISVLIEFSIESIKRNMVKLGDTFFIYEVVTSTLAEGVIKNIDVASFLLLRFSTLLCSEQIEFDPRNYHTFGLKGVRKMLFTNHDGTLASTFAKTLFQHLFDFAVYGGDSKIKSVGKIRIDIELEDAVPYIKPVPKKDKVQATRFAP